MTSGAWICGQEAFATIVRIICSEAGYLRALDDPFATSAITTTARHSKRQDGGGCDMLFVNVYFTDGLQRWAQCFLESFRFFNGSNILIVAEARDLSAK